MLLPVFRKSILQIALDFVLFHFHLKVYFIVFDQLNVAGYNYFH